MNISKTEGGAIGLPAEEDDRPPDYSQFVFYGIHTMKFVERINDLPDSPAAREDEVAVQARRRTNPSEVKNGESC